MSDRNGFRCIPRYAVVHCCSTITMCLVLHGGHDRHSTQACTMIFNRLASIAVAAAAHDLGLEREREEAVENGWIDSIQSNGRKYGEAGVKRSIRMYVIAVYT